MAKTCIKIVYIVMTIVMVLSLNSPPVTSSFFSWLKNPFRPSSSTSTSSQNQIRNENEGHDPKAPHAGTYSQNNNHFFDSPLAESRGGGHHQSHESHGHHGHGWHHQPSYGYHPQNGKLDIYSLLGGVSFASLLGATLLYLARRNTTYIPPVPTTGRRRRDLLRHQQLLELQFDLPHTGQNLDMEYY